MTTYAWPAFAGAFRPASMSWGQRVLSRTSTSTLNSTVQTTSLPGSRWTVSLTFPRHGYTERAPLEALFMRLSGQEHRVSLYDFVHPQRRGTCSLTGVTVASAAAQFAVGLSLTGCGTSTTLLAGDWIGVTTSTGAQLLQVAADATASAGGAMTIETRPMLRGTVAAGSAVVLDKPSALFILAQPDLTMPRAGAGICPEFGVDLVEVFS